MKDVKLTLTDDECNYVLASIVFSVKVMREDGPRRTKEDFDREGAMLALAKKVLKARNAVNPNRPSA